MLVLGIETATTTGSVALLSEEGVIAQYSLNIEVKHSERLMATIDRVLSDARLTLADVGGIAVSIGPGSFTGLRVGLATVKGLAFATGKPVAAVPTLRALAWNLPYAAHPVCPLFDAKKKEVYAALYRVEGTKLVQMTEERVVPLVKLLESLDGTTVFTGDGARQFRAEIAGVLGERALFAPRAATLPSAASVAEIGLGMIREGAASDPDGLVPMYLRRPEAEVAWEKRQASR
jgi:tRNA threonylcarbamoyladenosine biosynthesis protein TsaB